jgi:hypothetical protein
MNATELRQKLVDSGLPALVADSMVRAAMKEQDKANKPKKEKSARKWFPGMGSSSTKVEADVEVTSVCQTCGTHKVQTVKMTVKPDSPLTQRVAVSLCENCPAYFDGLEKSELISLLLLKAHPGVAIEHVPARNLIKMAKNMQPFEVVNYVHK